MSRKYDIPTHYSDISELHACMRIQKLIGCTSVRCYGRGATLSEYELDKTEITSRRMFSATLIYLVPSMMH